MDNVYVWIVIGAVFLFVAITTAIFIGCARSEVKSYSKVKPNSDAESEETEFEKTGFQDVSVDYDEQDEIVTVRCGGEVTTMSDVVEFSYEDPDDLAFDHCVDPIAVFAARRDEDYIDRYAVDQDGDIVPLQSDLD